MQRRTTTRPAQALKEYQASLGIDAKLPDYEKIMRVKLAGHNQKLIDNFFERHTPIDIETTLDQLYALYLNSPDKHNERLAQQYFEMKNMTKLISNLKTSSF